MAQSLCCHSAVHSQGAAIGPLAPAGSLRRPACLDASPAGRSKHRQCLCLRAVRRHGGLLASHLRRSARPASGNAQARLFGRFAAGIIAAGGTLGILLPPSITMILYAVAAEAVARPAVQPPSVGRAAGHAVRRLCDLAVPLRIPACPPPHGRDRHLFGAVAPGQLSMRDKFAVAAGAAVRALLTGVMIALWRFATPSETRAGADLDRRHLQRVDAAILRDPGLDVTRGRPC